MTSEIEALKTNEFLRRRKLRLQQVREQSKDIAKKIRQRAKVEKLKQVVELDAKNQKEYFLRQKQLVDQLEKYYAKGIENVGASHKSASEVKLQDPSKQRGKEAAAELRKKRQEKLDEQKKLLDRKLQARYLANEVSREKSAAVVDKLLTKASSKDVDVQSKEGDPHSNKDGIGGDSSEVKCNDMATQWELEPNEWEPNIPILSLPKDDTETNNNIESRSDKSKRLDLFALSDEMPSSLRGGRTIQEERVHTKPSLTLVSEYLQSRRLRLRETDTAESSKKSVDELHRLKKTILRTRASKEGTASMCQVHDEELVPVPTWRAENNCEFCSHGISRHRQFRHTRTCSSMHVNDMFSPVTPLYSDILPSPVLRGKTPFRRNRIPLRSFTAKSSADKASKSSALYSAVPKKSSVTMYNHFTRNVRDIPCDERLVVRDLQMDDDAYSQAIKETATDINLEKNHQKVQEIRSKVAMTKQNVEKEYRDTVSFLNSLPKGMGDKPINKARSNLKSPSKLNDDFDGTDFQYSWMPVPEGDGNLAIHTIPTSLKEPQKSGNTVKFSKVDSYHEYRSRHKHTPPTKDTTNQPKRLVEAVLIDNSSDSESVLSEISSTEDIRLEKTDEFKDTSKLSDAERIIIYKILDSKNKKNKSSKIMKDIANSLTLLQKQNTTNIKESVYKTVNEKGTGASNPCDDCKCGCKNTSQQNNTDQRSARQPSAATSTSSFKTATNNALPDGGYIKLVDEGGEEAGKFFIGASGFLKDDAYEVVIQLRKKGDEKDVREINQINEEDLVNNVSVATAEVNTPLETVEASTDRGISNASNELNKSKMNNEIHDFVGKVASEVSINQNVKHASSESQDVNTQFNVKEVSEKGVSTSFEESFAIPIQIPKSDSNTRPATSAYTQTSMSSPNHRPVFFHMSSSASTAYMSPPEMILPKFLIQDHRMSDDDLYDPRNFEMQDKIEMPHENEYCEDYECKCRKCRYARKKTCSKTNAHRCNNAKHRTGHTETPPNTARNYQDELEITVTDFNNKENCQCRKRRSRNRLDKPTSSNSQVNKNKTFAATKQSSQNQIMGATTSSASTKKDGHKRRNKSSLNPTIRDYVNKLLALSKESLKAVQVVDQDCSSVATPGSSIINVPNNNDDKKPSIANKISLEQIKTMLKQQIFVECEKKTNKDHKYSEICTKDHFNQNTKLPKGTRRKTVHKVKSLNISKHLFRTKNGAENKQPLTKQTSSSSSTKEHLKMTPFPRRNKVRSKSSPTPRTAAPTKLEVMHSKTSTNVASNGTKKLSNLCTKSSDSKTAINRNFKERKAELHNTESSAFPCHRATTASTSPNSETSAPRQKTRSHETPSNMSTQTSINVDNDINFLRFDEDKIQNMEKIADLTDICTKRLSHLAKVLDEVRRNKSLIYSQISTSDTASDSDQKSDKNANKIPANVYQSFHDTQKSLESKSASDSDQKSDRNANKIPANVYQSFHDTQKSLESKSPDTFAPVEELNENGNKQNSKGYVPFLNDIPKPDSFKTPTLELNFNSLSKSNPSSPASENYEHHMKSRGKPPPALSRINLKHFQDNVIPHELSTVVEVDSPMSVKLKSQTYRNGTRLDVPDNLNRLDNGTYNANDKNKERSTANLDLLVSTVDLSGQMEMLYTESSDDSKIQMIDMNQFNEIMLKPFFSLQEYAKHHNVGALDDGSNVEDFTKRDVINDELSSLQSDGSLPDVIAELLKRNIISEPFKFDTGSNVNSTTISSESTLSALALSKVRKEKKKSTVMFHKENIGETSDTLSISSNPDLENAFKRLGMGWASSTLKKTKERLALSSSSNTSSTSLSQFKIKSFNQDIPDRVTDTASSVLNLSNRPQQKRNATDSSKNAEQQTALTNSMTVKEFLTNELAKKITFNNKSNNDTDDEFVSLFETKMPEEMNHASRMVREDSVDNSMRSATNRARTSTPVQLFKSMTYQSSSSSNVSNGLFSNADDLSSVKHTSNSMKHSTSDKDDLTIPNFSLRIKKGSPECRKSD
ncbi:Serine/threonine-protein kinase SBK1 [Operophtera brumata]|uniref:Serine/threonine-protein kinase SBK1 n=1 Tax=Operophtera brumata TaxID=104452 RepID=A0A0L7KP63_OPEBR|nr:Serine/threonine-protein kinase SBK1 [Operophtera brumata]